MLSGKNGRKYRMARMCGFDVLFSPLDLEVDQGVI